MAAGVVPVALVIGPTAAGKTAAAMALQDQLGGPAKAQLISADSALVYRGMDIGTAKPDAHDLAAYPHRLIDIRDPSEPYSAAEFVSDADAAVLEALEQQKTPIIVGGTMLYVQRFIKGIAELPAASPRIRHELQQQLARLGADAMHAELLAIDPIVAAKIHPHNHQRLLRALEVIRATGRPMSSQWQAAKSSVAVSGLPIKLVTAVVGPSQRQVLHERIRQRFEAMLQAGFLAEVEALMQRDDLHPDLPALRAVGYRQAWHFLRGDCSHGQFVEAALAATRQLAKRQLTWLRRWSEVDVRSAAAPEQVAAQIRRLL